jgi:hypothetical protein
MVFLFAGVRLAFRFRLRGLFSLWLFWFAGSSWFGGDGMIVYSTANRLYGDCYDLRETTREIPAMVPAAFIVFYYCDVRRAFGKSVGADAKNMAVVPVLIVSRNAKPFHKESSIVASCFRVYDTEAHFCLWSYNLGGTRLPDSSLTQKYKLSYYLSGASSKFEKNFFILIFDRRSDASRVVKKTLEVFRKIFDLLGADFSFHHTSVYSLIEYMYNPIALFSTQSIGGGWCRLFVDGLREGVVNAFKRSSKLLPAFMEKCEIVRWR